MLQGSIRPKLMKFNSSIEKKTVEFKDLNCCNVLYIKEFEYSLALIGLPFECIF
jgi:hypothetical protein